MLTIGVFIITLFIAWYLLHREVILQQLAFAFIYLVALTMVGKTDILLPIYCVVVSASLLLGHIHSVSALTIGVAATYFIYIVVGFLVQDFTATCINFLSKFFQFCIPLAILDSDWNPSGHIGRKTLLFCLVAESIVGVMTTLYSGFSLLDITSVQLTADAQPVVGNMTAVTLPLLCLAYCRHRENTKETGSIILISLGMGLWVVWSGIRGYLLLFGFSMLPIYIDYFLGGGLDYARQYQRRLKVLFFCACVAVISLFWLPQFWEYLSNVILRLKNGTLGSRTFENAMTLNYLKRATLMQMLFGIGLAGRLGDYEAFRISALEQGSRGMWGIQNILNSRGTFHSLYDNIFLRQGLTGVLLLVVTVFVLCRRIYSHYRDNRLLHISLYMFLLGFLLMNYFRWSGDCGITEMVIFALILKTRDGGIDCEKGTSYSEV